MPKKGFIPNKLKPWIEARKKYRLSHAQVQMAREIGLNPKKFGKYAGTKNKPWKLTLPLYIEKLYFKCFKKERPENVKSIEQIARDKYKKKESPKQDKVKKIDQGEERLKNLE